MNSVRKALATLSLIPASFAVGDTTEYPLSIINCGQEIHFSSAPSRAVTIGQSATEILYALGVGDRLEGTSVWFNPVLPEFQEINAGVERIADNDPSFEAVVNKHPELVAAQYEWHVGPTGSVATRDQFHDLGIATYIMPADCDTKDNATGGDGTRTAAFSIDSIYKGITELASIFDVKEAGKTLISDLESREKSAIIEAKNLDLPDDLSAVFWFSSPDGSADPYVAGRLGAPGYMMDKLGLRNVIQSDEEWPVVGWESIARSDPDIIVVARMDRRRYAADSVEAKLDFLHHDPVAREMSAVKNDRIIEMDAHAMSATMRTIFGLETLVDALSTLSFER
ncbi:ABC transporter substrate-binding protein [Halomonas elongata]|uniref:ABC transporter substrate-binding protein n=1 Tax=Halomonas elongata TaxID=2746 RepID=UPI00186B8AD6|nr:ABC transporter substrate-binding protein [Halomonas elongata]MBW5801498.1 ABC transporter substrate-binding protein [Halomonas elongata]MDL4864181.1 ABC transporter substrate-binding protein [Halomonas elongata]